MKLKVEKIYVVYIYIHIYIYIYIYIYMDTVINVVPNFDISKTRKITFFSIISKISIFASQEFVRIYLGVVQNYPIGVF